MALVICSDKNLFWQGVFFLQRACAFDPDHRMDVYYYVSDPFPERYRKLLPPRVNVVQWTGEFPKTNYGLIEHVSEATLLRIFALDDLVQDYPLVFYSDIDVFLRWGNLADLQLLPPFTQPAAAVRDRALWGREPHRFFKRRYLPRHADSVQNKYFNAGVLLANGPVWRDEDVSARALRLLTEQPEFCYFADQTALNAVISGNWLELSPAWNWQSSKYSFMVAARDPRVVHLMGANKPWSNPDRGNDEYYHKYIEDWLMFNQLHEELATLPGRQFSASKERKRTRLMRQTEDPLAVRGDILPYIDGSDFADIAAGIQGFGWHDDR